ncbi:Endonuclease/exonuclease/phosphatase, partial [Suillus variegatus]
MPIAAQANNTHPPVPQTRPPAPTTTGTISEEKRTRANIKLASLNVRGRTSPDLGPSPISKWAAINRMMRDQKIGILCIQETHLCPEHQMQIENLYTRRLTVLNSSDPTRPGSSAGVAFILNNEITNSASAKMQVLIPGRATSLSIKWHESKIINILNIYAPNNQNEHKNFWEKISAEWSRRNLGTLDFMMGDFNLTEDPIDRAPARPDNEAAIDALRDLRTMLNIQDTWRITHPSRRLFTFSSNHQSLSRLDRIYVSVNHADSLLNWDSLISQVPTDHQMVTVRFAPPNLPHIGKGRWSWPAGLITDAALIKRTIELGMEMQNTLDSPTPRSDEENPQKTWLSFKTGINKIAKEVAKTHLCKINQRIRTLMKDLRQLAN